MHAKKITDEQTQPSNSNSPDKPIYTHFTDFLWEWLVGKNNRISVYYFFSYIKLKLFF